MQSHRREIPLILRPKVDLYSSRFSFNDDDDSMCLVTYQAKKKKNHVVLLSLSHNDAFVDNEEKKKPLVILDHNERKSGVDMFDINVEQSFCRRKPVCWLLFFFATCYMLEPTMHLY